jgi:hypothetical protein
MSDGWDQSDLAGEEPPDPDDGTVLVDARYEYTMWGETTDC